MDPNLVPAPDQNPGPAAPVPQPVEVPPQQLPQVQQQTQQVMPAQPVPVQPSPVQQAPVQQPVPVQPAPQEQYPMQQPDQYQNYQQQPPQQQPMQPQMTYPQGQQPMVQPQGPVPGSPEAQAGMRSKILKIIAGLVAFSLIGVGGIFLLSGSADGSLVDLADEVNNKATYKVPKAWVSDSSIDGIDYFNGDSKPASSAVVSAITPQRLKFSGEPLTEAEVAGVIQEVGNLESRGLDGDINLITSGEIGESGGFQRVFEYHYEASGADSNTKVIGKLRLYFDEEAYLHGFEVAAVKNYWNANQPALESILETYTLVR